MNLSASRSDGLESTSTSLVARVMARDRSAWERFVELYGPTVFQWCRRAGLTFHDAADVVQEVFAAVAAHIQDFQPQRSQGSFRSWLWTITRNKVRDHHRRLAAHVQARGGTAAQQQAAQIPEPQSESEDRPDTGQAILVQRALELLRSEFEERTYQAFWRMAVERRSAAEVAAELGMTSRAVRQAKYRVLCRLRQELDGWFE
jgi:RNA polymerase sigma-70 factor, ECF subfamily